MAAELRIVVHASTALIILALEAQVERSNAVLWGGVQIRSSHHLTKPQKCTDEVYSCESTWLTFFFLQVQTVAFHLCVLLHLPSQRATKQFLPASNNRIAPLITYKLMEIVCFDHCQRSYLEVRSTTPTWGSLWLTLNTATFNYNQHPPAGKHASTTSITKNETVWAITTELLSFAPTLQTPIFTFTKSGSCSKYSWDQFKPFRLQKLSFHNPALRTLAARFTKLDYHIELLHYEKSLW